MSREISLHQFENEQWNHPDQGKKKYCIWIEEYKPLSTECREWIEENCAGRYFVAWLYASPHSKYRRIWFEDYTDAVLFTTAFGVGTNPSFVPD